MGHLASNHHRLSLTRQPSPDPIFVVALIEDGPADAKAAGLKIVFCRAPGRRLKAEASDSQGLAGVIGPEDMPASDHMPCRDLVGRGCERASGHLKRKVHHPLPSILRVCVRMMRKSELSQSTVAFTMVT